MAEDAVKVAPHVYKAVLENDRVRVLEARMKPGEKTAMHGHPAVVAYLVGGVKVKFTDPNGQAMELPVEPGHAMYMDAADHSTENTGAKEVHVILVELK